VRKPERVGEGSVVIGENGEGKLWRKTLMDKYVYLLRGGGKGSAVLQLVNFFRNWGEKTPRKR